MTNFIFLDIDGVLVHMGVAKKAKTESGIVVPWSQEFCGHHFLGFPDPDCMRRLNGLVEATKARVILSSTWRIGRPLEVNNLFLQQYGAEFSLVGQTSTGCNGRRGAQIALFLRDWKEETTQDANFVVLDDEVTDIRPVSHVFKRTVHVREGWKEGGLQDIHVKKAKEILLKGQNDG